MPRCNCAPTPNVFFAGQISGVEGYVESIATGFLAGRFAAALAHQSRMPALPRETALGSLCHYISAADPKHYQPANIAFDLFPPLDEPCAIACSHDKPARHAEICRRAQAALEGYMSIHV